MFLSHISQKFPSFKWRIVPESTIDTSTFALDSVRLIHVKMMMLMMIPRTEQASHEVLYTYKHNRKAHIIMLRLSLAISVRAVTIFSSIVHLGSSAINIYLLPQVNNNLFL